MYNKQNPNQPIRGYHILEVLSEGEAGAFLRAQESRLGREVALVVLREKASTETQSRDQILQEADAASLARHTGVARVYEFCQAGKHLYVAMEYIPGPTLRQLLDDLGSTQNRIAIGEALQLTQQIALALAHVYQQGISFYGFSSELVKLRLKPGNSLPYHPVLQDPGLSILCEAGLPRDELVYVPPERSRHIMGRQASDVFSLGVLLHELLIGQPPYPVRAWEDFSRFYGAEYHPFPRNLRPDLPDKVEEVLLKALEKQPGDRYPDIGAFATALGDLVENNPAWKNITYPPPDESPLLAALRLRLGQAPAPSVPTPPPAFPHSQPAPSGDTIQITDVDGKTRSVPMKSEGLTIGRGEDNHIILDDPMVSNHHARVYFDGTQYRIHDLSSKNGTFLGNTRLGSNQYLSWNPGTMLHIGGAWLRLQVAGKTSRRYSRPTARPVSSPGVTQTMSSIPQMVMKGRIGLSIEEVQFQAIPGSLAKNNLTLYNNGSEDDLYHLSVSGGPEEWIVDLPDSVQVPARSQSSFEFSVQPPRSPESKVGRISYRIRITSQRDPRAWAEADLALVVVPYTHIESELDTTQLRPGELVNVKVTNQGNSPDSVLVRWEGEGILFVPDQMRLDVPYKQSAVASSRPELVQRRLFGGEQELPFTATVQTSDKQEQAHTGNLVSSGMAPLWLPPVAVITLLILFVGMALAAIILLQYNTLRQAAATASIQTATGEAIAFKTQQAVTATAVWNAADLDGDGLSNQRELLIGTRPDKADSDGDGLNDAKELTLGTDPTNADTDGDGWKDGHEVSRGTDPLLQDTDGDGTPDPQDPDPFAAPTVTLTPTIQATASAPNNPPVNTFPRAVNSLEDTPLVFSGGNGNQIVINDPDAGLNPIRVTLTVSHGKLSLNGVNGLTFSGGDGSEDRLMTFTGSVVAINTSLNGLTYLPEADFFGAATIQILTNDQGHSGQGGAKNDLDTLIIDVIPVNDPPTFVKGKDVSATGDGNEVVISGWAQNISPGPSNETGQKLNFEITTSNDSLFLRLPTVDPVTGDLSFTPAIQANGDATASLKLHDYGGTAEGGSDTSQPQTFTITIKTAQQVSVEYLLRENRNSFHRNARRNPLTADILAGIDLLSASAYRNFPILG